MYTAFNVVEPDVTVRLIISDKTQFPGAIVKGKEYPHDRDTAGMIFFNDEATENGGLIFGGRKDKDGKTESYGHFEFRPVHGRSGDGAELRRGGRTKHAGISFIDEPDPPIDENIQILTLPEQQRKAKWRELYANNPPRQRVYLGRKSDKSSALELKDAQGRDRLVMTVGADASASLKFLDEQGKIVAKFPQGEH